MPLRYKGKPDVGFNVQADRLEPVCFCRFRGVGLSMNTDGCPVHGTQERYGCDMKSCQCYDYRPAKEKKSPGHWPLCVCGHCAQDHN